MLGLSPVKGATMQSSLKPYRSTKYLPILPIRGAPGSSSTAQSLERSASAARGAVMARSSGDQARSGILHRQTHQVKWSVRLLRCRRR